MNCEHTKDGIIFKLPVQFYQAASASFLTSARNEIDQGAQQILVDFKETVVIDSSSVGALVSLAKECKTRNVALVLGNLINDINDLFVDTGLDKIFNIQGAMGLQTAESDIFERTVDIRLDVSMEIVETICIFHLKGVVNHPQGSKFFKQQFLLAMAKYKKILLDLEELTFFDSLSISVVLNMNKLIKETGGELRMCAANYIVSDLFSTLNIDQIIPVFKTVTDTLNDWL